jgi:hypothetical protein
VNPGLADPKRRDGRLFDRDPPWTDSGEKHGLADCRQCRKWLMTNTMNWIPQYRKQRGPRSPITTCMARDLAIRAVFRQFLHSFEAQSGFSRRIGDSP